MPGQISQSPKNHHHTGVRRGSCRHPRTRHFKRHTLTPSCGRMDPGRLGLSRFLLALVHVHSDALEPTFDVTAEMDANHTSLFVNQCEVIAQGLGALQRGEPIGFTRNRNVLGYISREHDEDTGVRPTLVELARGMQVPRPISERSRHPVAIADSAPEGLQGLMSHRRALKVGQ